MILRLLERYAPLWLAGLLGAGIMAAVMASDSQILALSTMFTEDVFAFYGGKRRFGEAVQVQTGRIFVIVLTVIAYAIAMRAPGSDLRPRHPVCLFGLRRALAAAGRGAFLARQHEVGGARLYRLDGRGGRGGRRLSGRRPRPRARPADRHLVSRRHGNSIAHTRRHSRLRLHARRTDGHYLGALNGCGFAADA